MMQTFMLIKVEKHIAYIAHIVYCEMENGTDINMYLEKRWSYVGFLSRFFYHSGRSPKVVALFSATNFSSFIIELLQLYDTIQIKWNYAWIHCNIAIRKHLMI